MERDTPALRAVRKKIAQALLQRAFRRYTEGVHSQESSGGRAIHSEEFLRTLMRRQLRLSVACALAFLGALLLLPLLNYYFPDAMAFRVGGFPLTWLILGVLFFPFVWAIAWIFIRRSIALEEAEVKEVAESPSSLVTSPSAPPTTDH